jgi:GxxExxY protein
MVNSGLGCLALYPSAPLRLDAFMTDAELTHQIIGAAIDVHRELGPGLLENVYEECLCCELLARGIPFEKQKPIPVVYKGLKLDCGYRADIVVGGRVVVEIKAISAVAPVHDAVTLTYLRLSGSKIGLLINFHSALLKNGIHCYVWKYETRDEEQLNAEAQSSQRKNA